MPSSNRKSNRANEERDDYVGGYEPRRSKNASATGSLRPSSKNNGFPFTTTSTSLLGKAPGPRSKATYANKDSSGDEWSDEDGRDAPEPSRRSQRKPRSPRRRRQETRSMPTSVRPKQGSPTKTSFPAAASMPSPGFIDPWEVPANEPHQRSVRFDVDSPSSSELVAQDDDGVEMSDLALSPRHSRDVLNESDNDGGIPANATFIAPSDIHPNMISREEDIAQLRLLAGKLSVDWRGKDYMAPALARRIRDFQFAQDKRRRKYGDERPWGILGLYDHVASIRVDVEWAEDAAWRRANGEPYLSWADFDASKKKGINRPFFTYFLLLVCSAALIASFAVNGWVVEPLDVNPMIGPSAQTLITMGAKDSYLIVYENEAWRLVSSTILHAGLVHYFINMLALWFVGNAIETSHGSIAHAILFIIPAVGGTTLSAIFLPEYITVGASGGIFGLIGACLADIVMNWKLLFNDFVTENGKKHHHVMVIVFLLLDIILNCLIGLTPYVDNFTHLGGMVIGFLCGISTMERLSTDFFGMEQGCWAQAKQIFIRFFGLIVSVIGILIATIILLEGDGKTNPCPGCTWFSCVPMPPWAGATDKWWYCDDCGRVTAEIVKDPSLHLELTCPDGTSVVVGLDSDDEGVNRDELVKELPSYCREYCPNYESRF